jgi:LysR family transcriptional regulator, transcriptional activator for dmlA
LITGTAGSNRAGGNVRRRNAQVWNPHEEFVLDGVGISILPLWMAKDPAIAADLERVLPLWVPDPVSLCALYSGTSDMIPKVKIFLDFMAAHLCTDLDPRLHGLKAEECFAEA